MKEKRHTEFSIEREEKCLKITEHNLENFTRLGVSFVEGLSVENVSELSESND